MKFAAALPLVSACVSSAFATSSLFLASLLLVGLASASAPLASTPALLWQWPPEAKPSSTVRGIAKEHARSSGAFNAHHAGLEILRHDLFQGASPWFPFGRGPFGPERTRFVNFGRSGFFLARTREGYDTLESAFAFGEQAPTELLESAGFPSAEGIFQTQSFLHFSHVEKKRRTRVLAGDPTEIDTSLMLAWAGGLRCLAVLKGLAPPQADLACDPYSEGRLKTPGSEGGAEASALASKSRHRCVALGSRRQGRLEIFREGSARCYFQRSLADERFSTSELESRFACVDPSVGQLAFPSLPDTRALIPGARPGTWLAYEPRYVPPKVTRIVLGQPGGPRFEPLAGATGLAGEKRGPVLPQLPDGFESAYACQSRETGADGTQSRWRREWLFVDAEVFEGRRALDPDVDRAFRVTADDADTLAIEALDWNDVTLRTPALDALPRLSCLLAPALDVKCGLKVLRQGGQMATEILAGAWDDTLSLPVRWGAVGLLASALADVETHLPGWALEGETRALRSFFEKELEALRSLALAEGAMEAPLWWKEGDALRRARLQNLPKVLLESGPVSAEARIALLRTTALPPELWQRLAEGKKNRTTDHEAEDTVKDFEDDRP